MIVSGWEITHLGYFSVGGITRKTPTVVFPCSSPFYLGIVKRQNRKCLDQAPVFLSVSAFSRNL